MSGQLNQAQTPVVYSKSCLRRGFLSRQSAYPHATRWGHTHGRRIFLRPVEKPSHKGARLLPGATRTTQAEIQAVPAEQPDSREIGRHSKLVLEVAYLRDLVETLANASTAQAKVSLYIAWLNKPTMI